MLITREMDYTLRTVRALHRGGQLSAAAIAEREHMQKAITLKILKKLHAAKIVESRRGVSGGYVMASPCENLTMQDLFAAMNERLLLNRCQEEGYLCENDPSGNCGVCRELCRIQSILNVELRKTPLSDLF